MIMRIGVFDSGVGGLTVLKALYEEYKNNEYVYIGDNKHNPYGNKSKDELFMYASNIIDYFKSIDIKLVVIGCNTICSNIFYKLKEKYKDMILIGVIDSTIDLFIKTNKKNVLIIGTENTIKSGIYENRIKDICNNVYSIPTKELVPRIEKDLDCKDIIDDLLKKYKNIDSIILACTHYKLIEHLIPKNIACIDSSTGIINTIKPYINDSISSIKIYTTGNINEFNKLCKKIINKTGEYIDI